MAVQLYTHNQLDGKRHTRNEGCRDKNALGIDAGIGLLALGTRWNNRYGAGEDVGDA